MALCVPIPCVCSAHGDQKKALDPLRLKKQVVMSHYVGGCWESNLDSLEEEPCP